MGPLANGVLLCLIHSSFEKVVCGVFFAWFKIQDYKLFSALKMLFYHFLASSVAVENSAISLVFYYFLGNPSFVSECL